MWRIEKYGIHRDIAFAQSSNIMNRISISADRITSGGYYYKVSMRAKITVYRQFRVA